MNNRLTLEAYNGSTLIVTPRLELSRAEGIQWTTYYPGGIFGTLRMRIKRKVAEWWALNGAQRLVVRCGLQIAFEGSIDNLISALENRGESVEVTVTGAWGSIMMRRRWNKPWAEARIDQDTWFIRPTAFDANDKTLKQKMTIDRHNRLCFTPKNLAFANSENAQLEFKAPTGETVKRVTCNYELAEGAQAWVLAMWNVTDASLIWAVTSSGTGTQDVTLATPSQRILLYFQSGAAQTPAGDGAIFGQVSNLVVYTETGSINLTEVAKDIRAKLTDLNSTETYIGSNTLSLVPFIANGWDSRMADLLMAAAEYGDASYNPWACYLDYSERAPTPDGKPVLCVEQKPALTDCDYIARVEELEEGVAFERYFDDLWNWIIVEYKDKTTSARLYSTPDDDANLKDTTSITAYGQRDYVLRVDTTSSSQAVQAGRRFLTEHKDPKFRASGQIRIREQVKTKAGSVIPAAMVRAGKRVKILNAMQQGVNGGDLVFLISNTSYDHESTVVSLDGGQLGVRI